MVDRGESGVVTGDGGWAMDCIVAVVVVVTERSE